MKKIAFIDIEVDGRGRIADLGALRHDGAKLHTDSIVDFRHFISDCDFLCGHNIVEHDYKYLKPLLDKEYTLIDTLYFSPLLFPKKPYHKLVKDDKILSDELNNPLSDAMKAKELFDNEISAFEGIQDNVKRVFHELLNDDGHFKGFFKYSDYRPNRFQFLSRIRTSDIVSILKGQICKNADINELIRLHPIELAYALAIISTGDRESVTPAWVLKNYPRVETVIHLLRSTPCNDSGCEYCRNRLNARIGLRKWFGYDDFRKFNGEPLQENAVNAAIEGQSLLTIFPTGGGKSLTFQLPALMAGEAERALTVVISPLQSLMKDQVENLERKNIADAVYINGLLSPVERADALERVQDGRASILYIAPEQLRSKTIEKMLMSRTIARFVIDEAHCFSAWGQDFRIEYMYIGEFLKNFQAKKDMPGKIPVSCFTATAKPKVISDIVDYFANTNGLTLRKFTTDATRTNLRYNVLNRANSKDKYETLRSLMEEYRCPAIVYVSRTKLAENLAESLRKDGFNARAFHGQMDTHVKVKNQEDFINNNVQIIVATSAFGMGVDKSDVGLVVHYEISDSLENYVQEAGRAGRDLSMNADCFVLYNDDDLNKHFILLNQTKLTLSEINQVWKAVKGLTGKRKKVCISALEIARKAGWEDINDIETKVKSALAALENAGFIKRGMNSPRIFATSIVPHNMDEAAMAIDSGMEFTEEDGVNAKRIIKSLISERSRAKAGTMEAESRIDYLSDILGIPTFKVIDLVEKMRCSGILAKDNDMTAYLRKALFWKVEALGRLEEFLLSYIDIEPKVLNLKELNERATEAGLGKSNLKDIRTILFYWTIKDYIKKERQGTSGEHIRIKANIPVTQMTEKSVLRTQICRFIVNTLNSKEKLRADENSEIVNFSFTELIKGFNASDLFGNKAKVPDVQDALLFLAKTGIVSIEGGFMVLYNKLEIERLEEDNKLRYRKEHYQNLSSFYQQKIQQIHIVGEYANLMVKDYNKALEFVNDYFRMEFKLFIRKYFDSAREKEISLNVSKKKYDEIFGQLNDAQRNIISDKESRHIVVPAGPGSGKTFVLVRKLASLILMEDVKAEQLLMLTFSRNAATVFSSRLKELIGNAAKYVEIKTFHSYCFDILGQKGSLEKATDVVKMAVEEIRAGRVETSLITKSILVIDEAQDMSADEFALVEELIRRNEDLRVIAVGDDDQNIYSFRGSDSAHLRTLIYKYGATVYNMLENFRSSRSVVSAANRYARTIGNRLKSEPIIGKREEPGSVNFVRHNGFRYEQAVVNELISRSLPGSTCVLTSTNDEALIISALLNKEGRKARLIQSLEGFSLDYLAEFRFFTERIKGQDNITVSQELWDRAKDELAHEFEGSACLESVMKGISIFESEYVETKYISDWENFIEESQMEDFVERKESEIIVSTIHKAKGCEFDNVFISLKEYSQISDADRRAIYVGLTRAKNNLSVHFCGNVFSNSGISFSADEKVYEAPSEILLQLGHRDVVLEMFKGTADAIGKLRSGNSLKIGGDYLFAQGVPGPIAKFSARARERIADICRKGYVLSDASIRFIVWWNYHTEVEVPSPVPQPAATQTKWVSTPIILPDLVFRKA